MMTLEIKGLQKLARKLDENTREKALKIGMTQSGYILQRWIVRNRLKGPRPNILDRVTGRLASSITVAPTEKVKNIFITRIGTNVEYAPRHEFGIGIRPRPFMRPAFENRENYKLIIETLTEQLNEALSQ
jgi:phage gpG-like protein